MWSIEIENTASMVSLGKISLLFVTKHHIFLLKDSLQQTLEEENISLQPPGVPSLGRNETGICKETA